MEEFRGLASVVQVFRQARDHHDRIAEADPFLYEVLRHADQYMSDVEAQEPINLAAPVSPEPTEHEFHEAGTIESIEAWQNAGREVAPEDGHSLTDGAYLPTRDSVPHRGLFAKYQVTRNDNTDLAGGKHYGCPLFVLDIRHDRHARVAARRYAQSVHHDEPRLSEDLMVLVDSETPIEPDPGMVDVGKYVGGGALQGGGMVIETGAGVEVFSGNLAPLERLPEEHCGNPDPHQGHEWQIRGIPGQPVIAWCVGAKA